MPKNGQALGLLDDKNENTALIAAETVMTVGNIGEYTEVFNGRSYMAIADKK